MKCVLCENEQNRASFAPIPSKKVATIILLSCLARYNVITLEDAKKHYKDLFATRKRICKNHFVQAIMFLGWEIEQLCGEFPLNGISEAPVFVMSSLLVNLRTYRGLLDDTMPMEKKDVREFFNEYMAEFRDEITQRISTPGSVEGALFLKATANFDIKKEVESISQIVIDEQLPGTSDGRDADSPDFFVPKEELEGPNERDEKKGLGCTNSNLPQSSASSSDEGEAVPDLEAGMTCALCSVAYPPTQLRVTSKLRQRNVVFLACMVIKKVIKAEEAARIQNEFKRTQKRCCKKHYVEAATLLQEELRKCSECLPNEARAPLFIPMELLQLLVEQGNLIDNDVPLLARDVAVFYSDCLNKYHNGNEWDAYELKKTLDGHSNLRCRTESASRGRKRHYEDVDEKPPVQPKAPVFEHSVAAAGISNNTRNTTFKDPGTCVVCRCTRDKTEFYRTSSHADQNLILLSCLVLNGSIKANVAQVIHREMIREVQYVCKKHYMVAMLYIYKSKEKLSYLATCTFYAVPEHTRLDLVDQIRACANEIRGGFIKLEITEASVEKFYTSCETKFNVISRSVARDTGEKSGDTLKDKVCDVLKDDSLSATDVTTKETGVMNKGIGVTKYGSHYTFKYKYKALADGTGTSDIQSSNSASSLAPIPSSPRWLIQRKLQRKRPKNRASLMSCGLCGCVRRWVDVRKASAKLGRMNVLLACLMRQGLVGTSTAEKLYKDTTRAQKSLCHEHFIHAGAYLAAAVETLTGQYPILGLWNIPFDLMDNIVAALQDHLDLISRTSFEYTDTLVAHDVASFFNDYLLKYVDTSEWLITEVPQKGEEPDGILSFPKSSFTKNRGSVQQASEKQQANEEDEELFSNSIGNQGEDEPLFKVEKEEQPDIVITQEQKNADESVQNSSEHSGSPDEQSASHSDVLASQQESPDFWKTCCGICDYRGTEGLRRPSMSRSHNVVLLACTVMNNEMAFTDATKLLWKISSFNVMICEKHFIDAVRRIQTEILRLWGRSPLDGLDDVPSLELCQFLEKINSYIYRIDGRKNVVRWSDIKDFYNVCRTLLNSKENPESMQDAQNEVVEGDKTSKESNDYNNGERKPLESPKDVDSPLSTNPDDDENASVDEHLSRSAIDELCGAELSFQEEIPATVLMEQPIPHVDESLGTSGSNNGRDIPRSRQSARNSNETVDFRPIALFHFRQGLSVRTTSAEINATFGEDSVTERKIREWFDMFRLNHAQIAAAAITPQSQAQDRLMRALLDADPNNTIPQLAQQFGTSFDTIVSYLRMSGILKNVKRTILNERQRRSRMEICSGLILRQKRDPTFLDRIITYGEVWMNNSCNFERKDGMAAVWWSSSGLVHHYIVPVGGRMTAQLYFFHVTEMHKKLLRMKPELVENHGMIMLHDTQLPYISLGAIRALHQLGYEVLPFPSKSSDLLPTDYHFVPHLRQFMADKVCGSDAQLGKCLNEFIDTNDVQFYVSGIYDLVARWKKCFYASGDYFKT